jgi:pimeloyl-ACP methyl ester carboxylesterase
MAIAEINLSAGPVEYEDTGGSGSPIVLLHGFAMDRTLWRKVVAELAPGLRCIVPTLPFGGHRRPMHADADLSPRALARLLGELIDALELTQPTLVGTDTGGALAQILVADDPARVGRLVLVSCDAFENFPPGLPGRSIALAAKIPGGLNAALQPLRIRRLRRLPMVLGWMAKRPIPDPITDHWLEPALTRREIRRDAAKFLRAVDKRDTLAAAERLPAFDRPALVVWAAEDRVMPPEHGRRLAELLPAGRLVEVADSYTLVPEDQPGELTRLLREFVAG